MGLFVPKYGASAGGGGGGSGTVTSVALTVPAELAVAGSPITAAGTLAVTRVNQGANLVMAGPPSGGAATPGYRALVSADIPNNAANTTGNAATATSATTAGTANALASTLAVGGGGTGATALAAHGVLVGAGTSAVAVTATGTTGQVLTSNGASADPTWQAAAGGGLTNPLAAGSLGAASLQLVAAGDGLWQPAAHIVGVQANSFEVARYASVASATDYLLFTNSSGSSGNLLSIAVAGSSANLGLHLSFKGSGGGGSKMMVLDDGVKGWHFLSHSAAAAGAFESDDIGNGGPSIQDAVTSAAVPLYAFIGDLTTGLGRGAAGQPSLIGAGVEFARLGGGRLLGKTSAAAAASTAQVPNDGDYAIHKNTAAGTVVLAYNDGGTVKSVQLS